MTEQHCGYHKIVFETGERSTVFIEDVEDVVCLTKYGQLLGIKEIIYIEGQKSKCVDCGNTTPLNHDRCESCFNVWLNTEGRRIRHND